MTEEQPNKYQNGKIYKVVDNGYNLCYYGSTVQTLSKRLSGHKRDYTKFQNGNKHVLSVFKIFEEYGPENCKIELIELYPCRSKMELEKQEGKHIKDNECVNKIIVGRTPLEYYNDNKEEIIKKAKEYRLKHLDQIKVREKEYRSNNKDYFKEKNQQYIKEHRDEIKERRYEYYQKNKESFREKAREHYHQNKEQIINYKKKQYTCEACQECLRASNKPRHDRTKKHLENLEKINTQ